MRTTERLITAIRQHGHEAYLLPSGRILAICLVSLSVDSPSDVVWQQESTELEPRLGVVRNWLGY